MHCQTYIIKNVYNIFANKVRYNEFYEVIEIRLLQCLKL